MNDMADNRVNEAPQTFQAATEIAPLVPRTGAGTYRAKVFKSGNSLALRLPKALGLEAGMEMELSVGPGGGMRCGASSRSGRRSISAGSRVSFRASSPPRAKISKNGPVR